MGNSASSGNILGYASGTQPGLVSTVAQTFAGLKTFNSGALFTGNGTQTTLNWYEDGTWTPVVTGSTTTGTGTYSLQSGNFTRIGRMVFVQSQIAWTAHTGAGNMQISLPYTCANLRYSPNIVDYQNLTVTGTALIESQPGNAYATLLYSPSGGGAVAPIAFDTAATIYFSLFYMAA